MYEEKYHHMLGKSSRNHRYKTMMTTNPANNDVSENRLQKYQPRVQQPYPRRYNSKSVLKIGPQFITYDRKYTQNFHIEEYRYCFDEFQSVQEMY